ncbi:MAG: alanine racemase [Ruminococcaceae bacterium]|nr:alanine racemase [Oscillospiraceae bacterium]
MNYTFSRTAAIIDLENAKHNYQLIKNGLSDGTKMFPVIKADGYGHGASRLAGLYDRLGADMFCVACLDEALSLRNDGITKPILILSPTLACLAQQLIDNNIVQTVHSRQYADMLCENIPQGKKLKIHIKLDTGMRRIGFTADEHPEELMNLPELDVCGIFTHYAESDGCDTAFTDLQLSRYNDIIKRFDGVEIMRHTSNSAASLCMPEAHFDGVRPGIVLYGSYPSLCVKEKFEKCGAALREVMTFKSRVTNIFDVKKGESIGYSRTYFAPRDMTVATVCAGYADGVPRLLSNKGRVCINGNMVNITGNVCMDQFMVDITDIKGINLFDEVIIFGEGGPSCDEVADICGTITYEIYCCINKRVPRIYAGDEI